MNLAFIPSPSHGVVYLGPIPLRGYAFCIIVGVFVAVWLGNKRWVARGGQKGTVADIAVWAVPFGLIGGRLYHVITDYELYFGEGRDWVNAFKIWEGGLGIWGAISLGAVGAWIGCRRRGIPLPAWADALAPGIALAQACGRWGNWFNQELYGRPTTLPWALEIDAAHRPVGTPDLATYHPTFLYESLWCVGVALLVIWADRKFRLGHGRAFALYVAAYTVGRFWIEYMRVDDAHHILGMRLNDWTCIVVFLGAVTYLVISAKCRPGRDTVVEPAAVAALAEGKDTEAAASGTTAEAVAPRNDDGSGTEGSAESASTTVGGGAPGSTEPAAVAPSDDAGADLVPAGGSDTSGEHAADGTADTEAIGGDGSAAPAGPDDGGDAEGPAESASGSRSSEAAASKKS